MLATTDWEDGRRSVAGVMTSARLIRNSEHQQPPGGTMKAMGSAQPI